VRVVDPVPPHCCLDESGWARFPRRALALSPLPAGAPRTPM
jgi:hypothetical protein